MYVQYIKTETQLEITIQSWMNYDKDLHSTLKSQAEENVMLMCDLVVKWQFTGNPLFRLI